MVATENVTARDAYHDLGTSESEFFGAQARAYKTVGGSQVYTQRSEAQTSMFRSTS